MPLRNYSLTLTLNENFPPCAGACVYVQRRYLEEFKRATMTVFSEDLDASLFDSTARQGWHRLLQFIVDELSRGLADVADHCD